MGYLNIMCESMSIWCSYLTIVLQEVTTEGNQGKDTPNFYCFLQLHVTLQSPQNLKILK